MYLLFHSYNNWSIHIEKKNTDPRIRHYTKLCTSIYRSVSVLLCSEIRQRGKIIIELIYIYDLTRFGYYEFDVLGISLILGYKR